MAGQQYSTSSLGGYLSQPYLTQKLRSVAQPMFRFRQFVDVKEAIGKNRGNTWLYDKVLNVATQGGTLVKSLLTLNFAICWKLLRVSNYAMRKNITRLDNQQGTFGTPQRLHAKLQFILDEDIVHTAEKSGRVICETNTIPQTNYTIVQGTGTINEYGNSVPLNNLTFSNLFAIMGV